MRRFINKWTGSTMWVADNRVEEYKAAGHSLVAIPQPEEPIMNEPVQPDPIPEEEEKPEKKPVKRAVKKTIRKR